MSCELEAGRPDPSRDAEHSAVTTRGLETDGTFQEISEMWSESAAAANPTGLFPGDRGELPFETRRVLVQLLLGPSVDSRRHGRIWPILLRDEAIIRCRLNELFLDLVVDRDHQVAFTRQVQMDEVEIPVLLRRSPLSFLDSVLLLFLRQRLTQAEAQGDRAVVSVDDMIEHMSVFEGPSNTDKAGFAKRMRHSIEKMKHDSVLEKIRNSEDRFEVSPTLRLLFSAEEIAALTQVYQSVASRGQEARLDVETNGLRDNIIDKAARNCDAEVAGHDSGEESV